MEPELTVRIRVAQAFLVRTAHGLLIGTNANCPDAFRHPDDTYVQVACQADNVCISQHSFDYIVLKNFLVG